MNYRLTFAKQRLSHPVVYPLPIEADSAKDAFTQAKKIVGDCVESYYSFFVESSLGDAHGWDGSRSFPARSKAISPGTDLDSNKDSSQ